MAALNATVLLRTIDCAGVNELFDAYIFIRYERAGILSPSRHCHTLDASVNGYIWSFKPWSYIRYYSRDVCSISWKECNDYGPNESAQEKILSRAAFGTTGIEPNEVDYIKVYETGISLVGMIKVDDPSSVFRKLKEDVNIYYRDKY